MFRTSFQGAPHIMIMEAKGPNPLAQWDTKKVQCDRLFSKEIKTYVVDVTGQNIGSCKLPGDDKNSLFIQQNYFAVQLFLPKDNAFTLTLTVLSSSQSKIRLVFSTSVKQVKVTTLNARIPLKTVAGVWSTLIIDLNEILQTLFKNQELGQVLSVEVAPYCTLFRIFSLLQCPLPTIELFDPAEESRLLKNKYAQPPPFSKRLHVPLPEKVEPPIPFHIQIIDQFYVSLFDEKRPVGQLGVRDINGILESRRNFVPNFNGFSNYEQIQPKINKSQIQVNDDPPEQERVDQAYASVQPEALPQKATVQRFELSEGGVKVITRSENAKKPASGRHAPMVKTQVKAQAPAPPSVVAQTLLHLHQTHQQNVEAQQQLQSEMQAAVGSYVHVPSAQKAKDFSSNLYLNQKQTKVGAKPPQIMGDIQQSSDVNSPDYCNTNVDLTLNARPVQIDAAQARRKKDEGNPRAITPLRGGVAPRQILQAPGEPEPELAGDDLGAATWEGGDEQNQNTAQFESQSQIDQRQLVNSQADQQDDQGGNQGYAEAYHQSPKSVVHNTGKLQDGDYKERRRPQSPVEMAELAEAAMQNMIPDPAKEMDGVAFPDPATVIEDPVAYGLRYDPVTKAYYEVE